MDSPKRFTGPRLVTREERQTGVIRGRTWIRDQPHPAEFVDLPWLHRLTAPTQSAKQVALTAMRIRTINIDEHRRGACDPETCEYCQDGGKAS